MRRTIWTCAKMPVDMTTFAHRIQVPCTRSRTAQFQASVSNVHYRQISKSIPSHRHHRTMRPLCWTSSAPSISAMILYLVLAVLWHTARRYLLLTTPFRVLARLCRTARCSCHRIGHQVKVCLDILHRVCLGILRRELATADRLRVVLRTMGNSMTRRRYDQRRADEVSTIAHEERAPRQHIHTTRKVQTALVHIPMKKGDMLRLNRDGRVRRRATWPLQSTRLATAHYMLQHRTCSAWARPPLPRLELRQCSSRRIHHL
ncbi:hypothetical protein PHLGIDRAFT_110579, partial [Phlebiopsis gigantea 11061_1 CR5-6]